MSERIPRNQEEDLHRQELFRKARKGDDQAARELQKVYGVRLWSEKEKAKLVYEPPKRSSKKSQSSKRTSH